MLITLIAGIINGCSDEITCADLDKIADPVQKQKLIQECPQPAVMVEPVKKGHTVYGKSPVVNW